MITQKDAPLRGDPQRSVLLIFALFAEFGGFIIRYLRKNISLDLSHSVNCCLMQITEGCGKIEKPVLGPTPVTFAVGNALAWLRKPRESFFISRFEAFLKKHVFKAA